jgi:RNA polymerase-binding transcription factor
MDDGLLRGYAEILEAKERELIRGLHNREGLAAEAEPDFFDEIQKAADRALIIDTLDRSSARLREVRAALMRIADGSYGECVRCGENIAPKRLAAVPWVALCLPCQQEYDLERMSDSEALEFVVSG